jgi:ATP-dependent protease ClpP protease subunit
MYEALLYGDINEWSSKDFIQRLINNKPKDITVRVNTDGGEVRYGYGVLAKIKECTGLKVMKNDGEANSMGAFSFLVADHAEALEQATFLFHRAAFSKSVESDPMLFISEDKAYLNKINSDLRGLMEAKLDVAKFEKITKVTLDELFSLDNRLEVTLNAAEAKEVGLIQKIVPLTSAKKMEIEACKKRAMAKVETEIPKNKIMTVEQLQAEHPGVFAQIFENGKKAGVEAEKDRVEACLVFLEIDQKGVVEAIASGKPISAKQMADFSLKATVANAKKGLEEENKEPIIVAQTTKTKEELEAEAFVKEAKAESTYFKNLEKAK